MNGYNVEAASHVYYAKGKTGDECYKYDFYLVKVGASWRAFIMTTPFSGLFTVGSHLPHTVYDNNFIKAYVSWARDVESLEEMRVIAEAWAEMIQNTYAE